MKDSKLLVILLVSLIIIGLVILSNYLSFAKVQGVLTDQIRTNQLTETAHMAGRVEHHILEARSELSTLSKFPEIEALSTKKCTESSEEEYIFFDGKLTSILKADTDGDIIACSSSKLSGFLGLNIKNKDYFTIPMTTREPYMTGTVYQSSPKIILSVPLFETTTYTPYPNFVGDFEGVLLTVIEVEELFNLYLHPYIDSEKNFFILVNPETGETLLKSSGFGKYSEIKNELPQGDSFNTIIDFGVFGETVITSADMILGTQRLRLVVFTPLESTSVDLASLQIRHLFSMVFIFLIALLAMGSFVSLYQSRQEVQTKLEQATITLKKLGIHSGIEEKKYNDSDVDLDSQKVYLVQEDDENHSHELFISSLNRGYAGLGIIREDPEKFKKRYNLQKTSFIWLSHADVSSAPTETNIAVLFKLISQFIKEGKKTVVLIERMDYLISENDFSAVIKKVHALSDIAVNHDCIILLSVNPELLTPSQVRALEAETVDLYGRKLRNKINLSDSERAILELINKKNTQNQLVSYKDITATFNITKPTTRARISKLQGVGLLRVEQVGRFKSLKITSAGRKIIQ